MVVDSTAFDAFAAAYDVEFTNTQLGRLLRQRVWDVLAEQFTAGDSVLELACGTGEDARWLAERGVRVTATDGSADMLAVTRHKANDLPIKTAQISLQQLSKGDKVADSAEFDGVLSNFGGLNTIQSWSSLASALSTQVKAGGKLVLVPMGPYCPIETIWYGLHGQLGNAVRRFRPKAHANIGDQSIPIWYPSGRQLKAAFAPHFNLKTIQSLGLWLPPSYLGHWVERYPRFWQAIARLEAKTANLTCGLGDHYIATFEKSQP